MRDVRRSARSSNEQPSARILRSENVETSVARIAPRNSLRLRLCQARLIIPGCLSYLGMTRVEETRESEKRLVHKSCRSSISPTKVANRISLILSARTEASAASGKCAMLNLARFPSTQSIETHLVFIPLLGCFCSYSSGLHNNTDASRVESKRSARQANSLRFLVSRVAHSLLHFLSKE